MLNRWWGRTLCPTVPFQGEYWYFSMRDDLTGFRTGWTLDSNPPRESLKSPLIAKYGGFMERPDAKRGVFETFYGNAAVVLSACSKTAYDLDMAEYVPVSEVDFHRPIRDVEESDVCDWDGEWTWNPSHKS